MSESTTRWIGRPIRRREDPRFLRGQAHYLDDIILPEMTHMAVVRSPVAHALIKKIDLSAARRHSGVLAVVAADDLLGTVRPAPPNPVEGAEITAVPHPVLASGAVRYVGEPVAVVLADTLPAAQDAVEHVAVEYESLPAVTDPRLALRAAVRLHTSLPDNVFSRWRRSQGDVDGAFARAARVVRQEFRIPRLVAAPIETRGAIAAYDPGADLLTMWVSAQDPHRPLSQLSRMLGRPDDRIRVIVPDVGGGFGSKGSVAVDVAVAAWLAIHTRRPVKWVETRRENLATSYQGRGLDVEMELALDAAGTMLAVRARIIADLGAYLYPPTAMVPVTTSMLLTGAYAIPNASVEMLGVATNKVPTGPYRGAGRPEAAYLVERMVDLAALDLNMDSVALRRRNLIAPDRFPYRTPLGFTYDSGNYGRVLDRVCALLEYDRWRREQAEARRDGRLLGIGTAIYVERAGSALWESAAVNVTPAGRVVVRMGSTPNGQGHATTFSQIAAEVLQVDLEAITVEQGDSAIVPRGVGTFGSRSTTIGGSALLRAAERVKAKVVRIAAHLLEARPDDIVWSDGRLSVRGAPDRALTLPEIGAAAYQPGRLPEDLGMGLDAMEIFRLPGPVFPFGAYGAVVEIDPVTGEVRMLRLVAVDDAGRIVNPLLAEGQVIGGSVQGLGEALFEEAVYGEDGQFLTSTFAEYGIPRAVQVPPVASEFLETLSPLNPLGAKGIGEAGCIATPAAVANAVMDALAPLGIRHLNFPFTPRRVWEAILQARRIRKT